MSMVIPLFVYAENVKVDVFPTNDGTTMASLGLQALSSVPSEHVAFPNEMVADGGVFLSDDHALTILHPLVTLFVLHNA